MERLLKEYDSTRNVELFERLVTEDEPISTWEEFQRWLAPFKDGGCFRGHRKASWNLVTTLDRALLKTISVETEDIHSTSRTKIHPSIDRQVVSKVVLKTDQRIQFLEELRRMNIHSASLFPGLDGFARSLAVNLGYLYT